jgi:hypothetical protein
LESTAAPERATHEPAASGCPIVDVGVVAPSVVYLTIAPEAQMDAYRALLGIASAVEEVGAMLCWPGGSGT